MSSSSVIVCATAAVGCTQMRGHSRNLRNSLYISTRMARSRRRLRRQTQRCHTASIPPDPYPRSAEHFRQGSRCSMPARMISARVKDFMELPGLGCRRALRRI
jgi:hypothetical protein